MEDPSRRRGRRLRVTRWLTLVALMSLSALSAAPLAAQHLNFHDYTPLEGLPQHQVLALLQDPAGFVWVGSYGGLSRYDGHRFITYTAQNGLPQNIVTALASLPDGRLAVAAGDGSLCLFNDGSFDCQRPGRLRAGSGLGALAVDRAGNLWVAGEGGVARRAADGWISYGVEAGLPSPRCGALAADGDGTIWVGTDAGLARLVGGRFEVVARELPPIRMLSSTPRGLLVGTKAGLFVWTGQRLEPAPVPADVAGASYTAAVVDHRGRVWIAGHSGALRWDDGGITEISERSGLLSHRLSALMVDAEDDVWFGTDLGVSKLIPGPFDLFASDQGLPSSFVRALAEDGEGRLWAGTRAGPAVLTGDRFAPPPDAGAVAALPVYALLPRGRSGMLIGTRGGLFLWDGRLRRTWHVADGLPSDNVVSLEADADGAVWVGTSGGLARLRDERVASAGVSAAAADLFAVALERGADGRLWIGSANGGVTVLDDARAVPMGAAQGLTDQTIWDLRRDDHGRIWVASNGDGLFRIDGTDIRRITVADGLVSDFVWQVLPDREGAVWAYTDRGLDRIEGEQVHHFGRADGLVDLEGSAGASLETSDGVHWFGSATGLVRYVPGWVDGDRGGPPPVVIEEVSSEGSGRLRPGAEVAAGAAVLQARFAGLSFRDEAAVLYRHRLIGLSDHWSKPTQEPVLRLAGLSPGSYRLEVQASNGGEWSARPATFAFTILPAFWQTRWFGASVLLAMLALVALVIHLRTAHLAREQVRLEAALAAHTAELREKNARLEREMAEREAAEKALLASERRVREILEHTTNLFYSRGPDHRLTYVSPQTRSFLDCEPEEALRDWREFITDDPANASGLEQSEEALRSCRRLPVYELEMRTARGRRIWVEVNEAPVVRDGVTVAMVGALTDVTARKSAEAARRDLEERLGQAEKLEAVGRLAGGVAHDFNNLLTTIVGYSELAQGRLGEDHPVHASLGEVLKAANGAAALTRQLLAFGRKQVTRPRVLDLNLAVLEASRMLDRLVGENVELVTDLASDVGSVVIDPGQVEQVLVNLAVNSRDAMPQGGRLTVSTRSAELPAGPHVLLEVADTGEGSRSGVRTPPIRRSRRRTPSTRSLQETGRGPRATRTAIAGRSTCVGVRPCRPPR